MKGFFKGLYLILTLDCEQSARMTSESFDRSLTWSERWAVRLHNAFCKRSRNLAKQLTLFNDSVKRRWSELNLEQSAAHLSPEAKERIREQLKRLDDE